MKVLNTSIKLWHMLATIVLIGIGMVHILISTNDSVETATRNATNNQWKEILQLCPTYNQPLITIGKKTVLGASDAKVRLYDVEAKSETILPILPEIAAYEPQFAPDGSYILFLGRTDGNVFNLWRINPDGSNLTQLTPFTTWETQPGAVQISQNGESIVYVVFSQSTVSIQLMDNMGGNVRVIAEPQIPELNGAQFFDIPTFVNNDEQISYYTMIRSNPVRQRFQIVNLDGTNRRDISDYCASVK